MVQATVCQVKSSRCVKLLTWLTYLVLTVSSDQPLCEAAVPSCCGKSSRCLKLFREAAMSNCCVKSSRYVQVLCQSSRCLKLFREAAMSNCCVKSSRSVNLLCEVNTLCQVEAPSCCCDVKRWPLKLECHGVHSCSLLALVAFERSSMFLFTNLFTLGTMTMGTYLLSIRKFMNTPLLPLYNFSKKN